MEEFMSDTTQRHVRSILSDFVRFWRIFCMVSFRRRMRIAGGEVLVCCMQLS